jgi:hypothetical protein
LDFLAKALELPIVKKTPIQNYLKPSFVPPRFPNQRPPLKLPKKPESELSDS